MRNRFSGTCYKCGCHVPVGYGFFERCEGGRTKWRVQCVRCADGREVGPDDPEVLRAQRLRARSLARKAGGAK